MLKQLRCHSLIKISVGYGALPAKLPMSILQVPAAPLVTQMPLCNLAPGSGNRGRSRSKAFGQMKECLGLLCSVVMPLVGQGGGQK